MDKAEAAILAREDATAAHAPAKKTDPAGEKKPRSADVAAISQREWKARQAQQAADEKGRRYDEKFGTLEKLIEGKDYIGVINHLAEKHGMTFVEIVNALNASDDTARAKTPAEVAAETVREELAKADAARSKADAEAQAARIDAGITKVKDRMLGMAEKGTDEVPDRWDETGRNPVMRDDRGAVLKDDAGRPVTAIDYAWALVEAHHEKSGETLALEDAMDIVEAKLRERQSARRPKMDAGKPKPGVKTGSEAVAKKGDGKGGKPSFSNRKTSGVGATVPVDDEDEESDRDTGKESFAIPDDLAISRAAKKVGIRL